MNKWNMRSAFDTICEYFLPCAESGQCKRCLEASPQPQSSDTGGSLNTRQQEVRGWDGGG